MPRLTCPMCDFVATMEPGQYVCIPCLERQKHAARPPLDCVCHGRGCTYCTGADARPVVLSKAFTEARTQARTARVSSTVTQCPEGHAECPGPGEDECPLKGMGRCP
jgi:hypothetical protein